MGACCLSRLDGYPSHLKTPPASMTSMLLEPHKTKGDTCTTAGMVQEAAAHSAHLLDHTPHTPNNID
eukprot:5616874-Amphidinium_carterae.1